MRAPWLTRVWPIIILLSTSAVALLVFWFPEVGIRPIVTMCFLFLIPGMTVVRFFHTREIAVEWMLALVLSFVIDAAVAGIVLYAGQWSPVHIMSFLLGFCFSGAIAQLAIIRPAVSVTQPVLFNEKDTRVRIDREAIQSIDTQIIGGKETNRDSEKSEDPEDTEERPVVLLPLHLEDTQEKTIRLEKPQVSGKKASKG